MVDHPGERGAGSTPPPSLVEAREILEIRLDRIGTFEVQDRRERAAVQRGLDLFGGTGYADIAARCKLVQQVDDLTGLASRVCGGHRRGERLRIRWLAFRKPRSRTLLLGLR